MVQRRTSKSAMILGLLAEKIKNGAIDPSMQPREVRALDAENFGKVTIPTFRNLLSKARKEFVSTRAPGMR